MTLMARCAHPLLGASVSSRSKFGSQQHPAMYADVRFNSTTSSRSTGQTAALGVCVNRHRHRAKSSDADGASSEDVPGKEKGKKKTKKRRRLLDNAGRRWRWRWRQGWRQGWQWFCCNSDFRQEHNGSSHNYKHCSGRRNYEPLWRVGRCRTAPQVRILRRQQESV